MFMTIFSNSFIGSICFKIYNTVSGFYKNSFLKKFFSFLAILFQNSIFNTIYKKIVFKDFIPENNLFGSIGLSINKFFIKFRNKFFSGSQGWFLYSIPGKVYTGIINNKRADSTVKGSIFCRIFDYFFGHSIFEWPLYLLAFFPVFDYVFRNVIHIDFLATLWDDILLLAVFGFAVLKWLLGRSDRLFAPSPMDRAMIIFITIYTVLLMMNITGYMDISIDGFRVVVQFILWFFAAYWTFTSHDNVLRMLRAMLLVGTFMAFHGIYQYITKVPIPDSWIDRLESSSATRVFSILTSPNILGSLMMLFIPVAIGFIFAEKKFVMKLIYGISTVSMVACLIFTGSRSAQLAFIAAIFIFAVFKDKRLIFVFLAAALVIVLFVPSVIERFTYLFSSVYMESSARGGRLVRWSTGWDFFVKNIWFGIGLGRFGGAVAMNNKNLFASTFYMDNYWLKTGVEMGLAGLFAFLVLLSGLFKWVLTAFKNLKSNVAAYSLSVGMFAGMCGVFFHNFVENVFEVPMMVSFFWIFAACIMYLAFGSQSKNEEAAGK